MLLTKSDKLRSQEEKGKALEISKGRNLWEGKYTGKPTGDQG